MVWESSPYMMLGFLGSDSGNHHFGFHKIENTIDEMTGGRFGKSFWTTGDCDGRGAPESNPNGPLNHNLFMLYARDTIKLLRNLCSLAQWFGGNEQTLPPDINAALQNDLKLHPLFSETAHNGFRLQESTDPSLYLNGTRVYFQGSMWDGYADGKGDFTDGQYTNRNPGLFQGRFLQVLV